MQTAVSPPPAKRRGPFWSIVCSLWSNLWRGGRVAECGSLENCYTRKRIGSSNLPLSAIILCLFFLLPISGHAEILQLKNGNAIETKILRETEEFVVVEAPGGKVKIPKSNIQMIWRGSAEELLEVRGKEVYFAKGVELYKEGLFKEAAENFEQVLSPGTTNAILYANLGSAYASSGEARKAEENFLKALKQKPNDPAILLNLARLYEAQKDFKLARDSYQKLKILKPDDVGIERSLAYCDYRVGDFLIAAKSFEALGQKNDVVALCNSAAAYIQAGELDHAEMILKKLLAASFPVPRAYLNMATIHRLRKDYAQAENQYQKALAQDPQAIEIYRGLGQLYLEQKDWEKAEANFDHVLEKDPLNPGALYGLAQIHVQKNEFEEAEKFYKQLLEKSSSDLAMLNGAGLLYLKMNEPRKALEVYRRLFGIEDRYAKGHANAGLAYAFLEDADKALEEWTRALELDPKLEAAALNKKLLEEVMRGKINEKTAPK